MSATASTHWLATTFSTRRTKRPSVGSGSEHGANLAVISTAGVPERFKLAIEADAFSRFCDVARKAGSEIDVRFA